MVLLSRMEISGASLVAQWWRICLPKQETQVWPLVGEDPTCHWATKPLPHNCWACALEPERRNYGARMPQLLKPVCPRAQTPQQEKPSQWEAHILQLQSSPRSLATREKPEQQQRPSTAKKKKKKKEWRFLFSKPTLAIWIEGRLCICILVSSFCFQKLILRKLGCKVVS